MDRPTRRRGAAFLSVAFTGVATQAVTAVSGPLVARMLGPDGRGEMVLVSVVAMMASQLGVGGLPMAISHAVASAGRPALEVVGSLMRRWLWLSLLPGTGAAVASAILLRNAREGWLPFAGVGFVLCTALIWQLVLAGMVQGEGNIRRINVYRLAGLTLYAGTVAAMFVFARSANPLVILCVFIGSILLGIVVGAFMLRRPMHGGPPVDTTELRKFARLSYVSGVGLLDGLGLDLILVGVLLGNTALGLYAVALSATNLTQIVLVGVAQVLLPKLAAAPTSQAAAASTRRWLVASIGLSVLVVLGLQLVVAPLIRFAFGPQFEPMITCARILIVAWALQGVRRVLTSIAQAQGRAGYASKAEAACLVLMLGGVAAAGPAFGIDGAAYSVLAAALTCCVVLALGITWRAGAEAADNERDTAAVPA